MIKFFEYIWDPMSITIDIIINFFKLIISYIKHRKERCKNLHFGCKNCDIFNKRKKLIELIKSDYKAPIKLLFIIAMFYFIYHLVINLGLVELVKILW